MRTLNNQSELRTDTDDRIHRQDFNGYYNCVPYVHSEVETRKILKRSNGTMRGENYNA